MTAAALSAGLVWNVRPSEEEQMSDRYYVNDNAQPNGDHEVHLSHCSWLAMARSKSDLGFYANCRDAVAAARRTYRQSNGCAYCVPECHTG